MSTAQKVAEAFTEDDNDFEDTDVIATESFKSARIKGTWDMYWGSDVFKFEDRKRFTIPADLYKYLKARDCIYDTI